MTKFNTRSTGSSLLATRYTRSSTTRPTRVRNYADSVVLRRGFGSGRTAETAELSRVLRLCHHLRTPTHPTPSRKSPRCPVLPLPLSLFLSFLPVSAFAFKLRDRRASGFVDSACASTPLNKKGCNNKEGNPLFSLLRDNTGEQEVKRLRRENKTRQCLSFLRERSRTKRPYARCVSGLKAACAALNNTYYRHVRDAHLNDRGSAVAFIQRASSFS